MAGLDCLRRFSNSPRAATITITSPMPMAAMVAVGIPDPGGDCPAGAAVELDMVEFIAAGAVKTVEFVLIAAFEAAEEVESVWIWDGTL